jgi:hypothetical protein
MLVSVATTAQHFHEQHISAKVRMCGIWQCVMDVQVPGRAATLAAASGLQFCTSRYPHRAGTRRCPAFPKGMIYPALPDAAAFFRTARHFALAGPDMSLRSEERLTAYCANKVGALLPLTGD